MNIVDSSGWLEYFTEGSNADFFREPIEDSDELLVPTVSLYEVFKRVLQQRGEGEALKAVAYMQSGRVVDLTSTIALHAAKLSDEMKTPMADSIMLATSRETRSVLWTQDSDFEGTAGVRYIKARN
jgi:predicted nucleic acid-binding protein